MFYALTDSRTPTLLQLVIVAVKIPLLLAAPFVLPPQWVVLGLAAANGLSFVVGCGPGPDAAAPAPRCRLGTGVVLGVLVRVAVASVFGAALAFGAVLLIGPALPAVGPVAGSWIELMIAAVIGGPAVVVAMLALRVPEVAALRRRVTGKMARPTERGDSGR